MACSLKELVSHLMRYHTVPELTVLLTGTLIIPEDNFRRRESAHIAIDIESIGRLEKLVVSA